MAALAQPREARRPSGAMGTAYHWSVFLLVDLGFCPQTIKNHVLQFWVETSCTFLPVIILAVSGGSQSRCFPLVYHSRGESDSGEIMRPVLWEPVIQEKGTNRGGFPLEI